MAQPRNSFVLESRWADVLDVMASAVTAMRPPLPSPTSRAEAPMMLPNLPAICRAEQLAALLEYLATGHIAPSLQSGDFRPEAEYLNLLFLFDKNETEPDKLLTTSADAFERLLFWMDPKRILFAQHRFQRKVAMVMVPLDPEAVAAAPRVFLDSHATLAQVVQAEEAPSSDVDVKGLGERVDHFKREELPALGWCGASGRGVLLAGPSLAPFLLLQHRQRQTAPSSFTFFKVIPPSSGKKNEEEESEEIACKFLEAIAAKHDSSNCVLVVSQSSSDAISVTIFPRDQDGAAEARLLPPALRRYILFHQVFASPADAVAKHFPNVDLHQLAYDGERPLASLGALRALKNRFTLCPTMAPDFNSHLASKFRLLHAELGMSVLLPGVMAQERIRMLRTLLAACDSSAAPDPVVMMHGWGAGWQLPTPPDQRVAVDVLLLLTLSNDQVAAAVEQLLARTRAHLEIFSRGAQATVTAALEDIRNAICMTMATAATSASPAVDAAENAALLLLLLSNPSAPAGADADVATALCAATVAQDAVTDALQRCTGTVSAVKVAHMAALSVITRVITALEHIASLAQLTVAAAGTWRRDQGDAGDQLMCLLAGHAHDAASVAMSAVTHGRQHLVAALSDLERGVLAVATAVEGSQSKMPGFTSILTNAKQHLTAEAAMQETLNGLKKSMREVEMNGSRSSHILEMAVSYGQQTASIMSSAGYLSRALPQAAEGFRASATDVLNITQQAAGVLQGAAHILATAQTWLGRVHRAVTAALMNTEQLIRSRPT